MKHWAVFGVVALLFGFFLRLEPTGTDVAALEPVKLLYVDSREGTYYLATDSGHRAQGNTVSAAVSNLKSAATGKLYLDTAEYLLVSSSAWEAVGRLSQYLRPDCIVTVARGIPDAEKASSFLDTHKPDFTLNDFRAGEKSVPILNSREGGMYLEKP